MATLIAEPIISRGPWGQLLGHADDQGRYDVEFVPQGRNADVFGPNPPGWNEV